MRRKKVFIFCIAAVLILSGFAVWYFGKDRLSNSNVPQIKIAAEKKEIKYIGMRKQPTSESNKAQKDFRPLMKEVKMQDIPYLKNGAKLEMEFLSQSPKDVTLKNYILSLDGFIKYSEKEVQETPVELSGKTASFQLRKNPAAALSSNSRDYEPGAVLRGFLLSCRYPDGKEYNYTFIIRSDAL